MLQSCNINVQEIMRIVQKKGTFTIGTINATVKTNILFQRKIMNKRIAIAIEERDNGKQIVAEHFGRCSKFKVCEMDADNSLIKTEIYFNPLIGEHNGACQLPGYVKQFNVNTIIAGGMGQKAISKFSAFDIEVITAPGLAYDHALNLFIEGKFRSWETYKHSGEYHH